MPIQRFVQEKHESHSVSKLGYHLIWCPKFRHEVLIGGVEIELRHILNQTCEAYGWSLEELEIMPDHVHLFVQASPAEAPLNIAKTLKSISAVYLFHKFPKLKAQKFWGTGLWSPGTYYSSVGEISEEVVRRYIQTQKKR